MNNKFVRLINTRVVEVFFNTTTLPMAELFHADLACHFEPCLYEDVEINWLKQDDGTFIPPALADEAPA